MCLCCAGCRKCPRLHFSYISQSQQQRKTGPSIHSSSQLCLLTLICFPLLNNCWIEQNNEFGIFRIIKRVACFFEPGSVVRLWAQCCALTWGRVLFFLPWNGFILISVSSYSFHLHLLRWWFCREKVLSDWRSCRLNFNSRGCQLW